MLREMIEQGLGRQISYIEFSDVLRAFQSEVRSRVKHNKKTHFNSLIVLADKLTSEHTK